MAFEFTKMEGAGNDFLFCTGGPVPEKEKIAFYCDRRRGAGADGLIVITPLADGSLRMKYFNSDGSPAEMCGNGLRCSMEYSCLKGLACNHALFHTDSGDLRAWRLAPEMIRIEMPLPGGFRHFTLGRFECFLTKVGVPHAVVPVEDVEKIDVRSSGRMLRFAEEFGPEGANIDFIQECAPGQLLIRTYERGVEDETLACGTGITASAAYLELVRKDLSPEKTLKTRGKDVLRVEFIKECNMLKGVFLTGPAKRVFEGTFC